MCLYLYFFSNMQINDFSYLLRLFRHYNFRSALISSHTTFIRFEKFKDDCLDNEFWIELSPKTSINSQKNSTLAV